MQQRGVAGDVADEMRDRSLVDHEHDRRVERVVAVEVLQQGGAVEQPVEFVDLLARYVVDDLRRRVARLRERGTAAKSQQQQQEKEFRKAHVHHLVARRLYGRDVIVEPPPLTVPA